MNARPDDASPNPNDDDARSEYTMWKNGLQGPNTGKQIVDEVPRTVLGFVAACIHWALSRHDVGGNAPSKYPNMTRDDSFTNTVTWLVTKSTGLDMAMITREVKACEKTVGDQGSKVQADWEDGSDILSTR